MNHLIRQLKRFRVSLGETSMQRRDPFLRQRLKTPLSEVNIQRLITISDGFKALIPIIQRQPKFLRTDFTASVIAAVGSTKHRESVRACCDVLTCLSSVSFSTHNARIVALSECGLVSEAHQTLHSLPRSVQSSFPFNSVLNAYVNAHAQEANPVDVGTRTAQVIELMMSRGIRPDRLTLFPLLRAAILQKDLQLGLKAGELAVQIGEGDNVQVKHLLMDLHGKCGDVADAEAVFASLPLKSRTVVSYNTLMGALSRSEKGAVRVGPLLDEMLQLQLKPTIVTVLALLRAAGVTRCLPLGERALSIASQIGVQAEVKVLNSAVDMFGKCGAQSQAQRTFDAIPLASRTVVSYTSLLLACTESTGAEVHHIITQMMAADVRPTSVTVLTILKIATRLKDLSLGKRALTMATDIKVLGDMKVMTSALMMFASCGAVEDAMQLFQRIPAESRNSAVYNAILLACAHTSASLVSSILDEMLAARVKPDNITILAFLRAAVAHSDLPLGRRAWSLAKDINFVEDVKVATAAIELFRKCSSYTDALNVFRNVPIDKRDAPLYNTMLLASTDVSSDEVKRVYEEMTSDAITPDSITVLALLRGASRSKDLLLGSFALSLASKIQCMSDIRVVNAAIDMFSKCGSAEDAMRLFEQIPVASRTIVSYNLAFTCCGSVKQIDCLLDEMFKRKFRAEVTTIMALLLAAVRLRDTTLGERALSVAKEIGVDRNVKVATAAIYTFGQLGSADTALGIFHQVAVSEWDALLLSVVFSCCRSSQEVNFLLDQFLARKKPESSMVVSLFSDAVRLQDISLGQRAWLIANEIGAQEDVRIMNSAVDMFGKCGCLADAIDTFNQIPPSKRDVVSYSSLISAHSFSALDARKAGALLNEMLTTGIKPDVICILALLSCASVSAKIQFGSRAMEIAIEMGCSDDEYYSAAVIHMFGRCRRTDEAVSFFTSLRNRTISHYASLIGAFAFRGCGTLALKYYQEAVALFGVSEVLAVVCLQALSHSSMIDEAVNLFHSLPSDLASRDRVSTSMIDCYSRADHLAKAHSLFSSLRSPSTVAALTLLGGCRTHNDVRLGEEMFEYIRSLDPRLTVAYVLMHKLYASNGRNQEAQRILAMMKELNLKKIPGVSSAVIDGEVHSFFAHHENHERIDEIRAVMKQLNGLLSSALHTPNESLVWDLACDAKEKRLQSLSEHSERYAIAYAVLVTPPETDIDIVQNLRICGDCHETTKKLSLILKRRIYLRDSARYHCFENGVCDCGDRW